MCLLMFYVHTFSLYKLGYYSRDADDDSMDIYSWATILVKYSCLPKSSKFFDEVRTYRMNIFEIVFCVFVNLFPLKQLENNLHLDFC